MIQAVIKCFERSTVVRIEENSNDESRCLFYLYDNANIINTHKYGHGEMRNRKEETTIHKDGSSAVLNKSPWKRKGKKQKKALLQHGVFVFGDQAK